MTDEERKKLKKRIMLGLLAAGGAGAAAYGASSLRGKGGTPSVSASPKEKSVLSRVGKASPYFLASLPLALAARKVGIPALRNAVHVSEKTYNSKFLNKSKLGKWLKKFTRSSLYGDEVAKEARKNGIARAGSRARHGGEQVRPGRCGQHRKVHGPYEGRKISKEDHKERTAVQFLP